MYAAEAILEGQGGSTVDASSPSSEEAGKGFGEGPSIPADASVKRTPARLLLDEILTTDADKWNGILAGLSSPSSGQGMTGGVTKDGILGAIQVRRDFCFEVVGFGVKKLGGREWCGDAMAEFAHPFFVA